MNVKEIKHFVDINRERNENLLITGRRTKDDAENGVRWKKNGVIERKKGREKIRQM